MGNAADACAHGKRVSPNLEENPIMTTVATDQLTETIQQLKQAAEEALAAQNAKEFSEFERFVNEVEAFVRETQQSLWGAEAKAVIRKLERGDALQENDKQVIRTFLVSDAEHYLACENNYGDWQLELKRLMTDVSRRANMLDKDSIAELRGVLKDAIRLVPDIRNYLEERERVKKFDSALKSLDQPSRDMLAQLMREQLTHEKR